jgi:hypothetical protein
VLRSAVPSRLLLVVVRLLLVRSLVVRLVLSRSSLRWLVAAVVGWLEWVALSLVWLVGHSVAFVAECRPDSLLVGFSPVRI